MKSIKGSMAVAVMSAFFVSHGAAAASLGECEADIGWAAWMGQNGTPTGTTAAIVANGASGTGQFSNTRKSVESCTVPRNTRKGIVLTETIVFEDKMMTLDECSMYNAVASADGKFQIGKFSDAAKVMSDLAAKANTLAGQGKLSNAAASQIAAEAYGAATCLTDLLK